MAVFIFAHNVSPKRSGKNECRHSDLYFSDEMMHCMEVYEMLDNSPLCYYIISYMSIVAKLKVRETRTGFLRLSSQIFESYGVRLEGQWRVRIDHNDMINTIALRNI